jgi:hypothetical protein
LQLVRKSPLRYGDASPSGAHDLTGAALK